jgi:hypothetical protein
MPSLEKALEDIKAAELVVQEKKDQASKTICVLLSHLINQGKWEVINRGMGDFALLLAACPERNKLRQALRIIFKADWYANFSLRVKDFDCVLSVNDNEISIYLVGELSSEPDIVANCVDIRNLLAGEIPYIEDRIRSIEKQLEDERARLTKIKEAIAKTS